MRKIAVIGAGNLGKSIVQGILKGKLIPAENIFATRNRVDRLQDLADVGVQIGSDNKRAAKEADFIIMAVKPYKIKAVLKEIGAELNAKKTVVSVATAITLDQIKASVPENTAVFRAMPNTAAAVEDSITTVCSENASSEQQEQIKEIFDQMGETLFITEELMDSATVIGSCGLAFVLRFVRAMIQGGVEIGFDANTATKIVTQTVKGAAVLLQENQTHPESEIDKVTTPKGCTIAGLNEMEHQGFSSALIKGIVASRERI